ncbi:MAG: hypothetical protein SLAVMIC_00298 [uncultured marine phage]|uniref:Uncharacterized protein n=1 Tax=uncultured marine phage TaxID=707152 RepID=A0A8D9FQ42_9VIRU|nr:MAG: hypothetical protein SLAVMIC_00298 [uncultured marine phage]
MKHLKLYEEFNPFSNEAKRIRKEVTNDRAYYAMRGNIKSEDHEKGGDDQWKSTTYSFDLNNDNIEIGRTNYSYELVVYGHKDRDTDHILKVNGDEVKSPESSKEKLYNIVEDFYENSVRDSSKFIG